MNLFSTKFHLYKTQGEKLIAEDFFVHGRVKAFAVELQF